MIRRQSPEVFKNQKTIRNRRVKSEIPNVFKESSFNSLPKADSKILLQNHIDLQNHYMQSNLEEIITKHREVLLLILKSSPTLSELVLNKLKDLTIYPDFLTDLIYKHLRGIKQSFPSQSNFIEEIKEFKKQASNLQNQLFKAKQSNEELSNMLLSVDMQKKMNKDLTESLSLLTNNVQVKKKSISKKKILVPNRLEFDRILATSQKSIGEEGLHGLCEEVRSSILADNVIVFTPNPQCTYFTGLINGAETMISIKATVLSVVFHTGQTISAISGDHNFDPRIQQVLKMKVKAFQAGLLSNHIGEKIGILLIIRKRPEILFEKDFTNLTHIFSGYITRSKIWNDYKIEKQRSIFIIENCSEVLNTVTLQDFVVRLQKFLPLIFNCERGNILLFDYEKNNLFRKSLSGNYENFPIFHGLSGNCVNIKRPVICNDVSLERMFLKEMDDPEGENTKSIISVPVFSKIMKNIPEAVIQMINKLDGGYFDVQDEELMVKFANMITDCMIVLKFSQLSASLIDVIKKLEETLEKMSEDMSSRAYDFGSVKSSFVLFKSFFLKFL